MKLSTKVATCKRLHISTKTFDAMRKKRPLQSVELNRREMFEDDVTDKWFYGPFYVDYSDKKTTLAD